VQLLGERAEKVRGGMVDPSEDNMLKITGDGRKAALDMQLVTGRPASTPGKLQAAAENIARLYHATRERSYLDSLTGQPSATAGALQIVFCDLSTPAREGWNAYDQLRDELVDRGLPAERIRYIHQARDDLEKARLFATCRNGQVSVIVGSTQKMGVGTNIQPRAIALHHVDAPWRPADIAQRDGRLIRQGNQNPTVAVYRYVTEGSFDTYMWQTLERKARFIGQVMRGRLDVREIEDVGEDVLGFAELKAIASGDPLILQRAKIDAEVERLARVQRAWQRGHQALRATITAASLRSDAREQQIAAVSQALPQVRDTRAERFSITIAGRTHAHRTDAGGALARGLRAVAPGPARPVAQLAGLQVDAELRGDHHGEQYVSLTLHGLPAHPATLKRSQLADAGLSLIRQLEHRVQTLPELVARLDTERTEALREAGAARDQLARPFKYADQLDAARQEQQQLAEQLAERHHDRQHAEHAVALTAGDVDADLDAATVPASPPTADTEPSLDPQTAESLRILRATQPAPITEALRSPPTPGPPARSPAHAPSRSPRPRR